MARLPITSMARGASGGPALKSIGQLSAETGIPHHVLRYWETRFDQLQPVTRAGNRRYYRPEHVALVKRISTLLHDQGYTIRGVRHLLETPDPATDAPTLSAPTPAATPAPVESASLRVMLAVRDRLSAALAADDSRG